MFEIFTDAVEAGAENGVVAGLFIPLVDLPGMALEELSATGTTLESHEIYALLNALYNGLAEVPSLGIVGITKSNPTGTGPNKFTEGIGLTYQFLLNLEAGTVGAIPLATIGTEAGRGAVFAEDIWTNCEKVTAEGAIPGAGLVIPDDWVAGYGGGTLTAVDVDARHWIGALVRGMLAIITPRSSTNPSAITTRTNPATLRMTGATIPATWYDPTNPITGISAANVSKLRICQEAYLVEYEMIADPETQTLEIHVA